MIPNDDTCIRRQEIFYDLKTPENLITLIIIIIVLYYIIIYYYYNIYIIII